MSVRRPTYSNSGKVVKKVYDRKPSSSNAMVIDIPRSMSSQSGTTRQAMRVGGWANPSKGGELKFVDTSFTLTPPIGGSDFTTPGATSLVNGIANGSSAETRIGRKVTLKSILIRYSYALAATSVGGATGRLMVVYDKQSNATAPLETDILLADNFLSPNNLSNRDRFVTLFDHITDPISVQNNYTVSSTLYKAINLEENFNAGSAGTIGDITSGAIYCLMAQTGSITIAAPQMQIRCRVRYTDV